CPWPTLTGLISIYKQCSHTNNLTHSARPIFHRKEDSIQAHLTIVMVAMACGHVLERSTGVSLKRLVRTLKKYRSFTLEVGGQVVHARTPLPADVAVLIESLPKSH
ncbi:hypothetical protein QP814_03860, partial [Actinotignum timonense]|nr:hypothetical protein [Actinotignum timonense]